MSPKILKNDQKSKSPFPSMSAATLLGPNLVDRVRLLSLFALSFHWRHDMSEVALHFTAPVQMSRNEIQYKLAKQAKTGPSPDWLESISQHSSRKRRAWRLRWQFSSKRFLSRVERSIPIWYFKKNMHLITAKWRNWFLCKSFSSTEETMIPKIKESFTA